MAYSAQSPILGTTSEATAAHCVNYILGRKNGDYTAEDIRDVIVPAYFRSCKAVGVEPVMVIAQLIHETGTLSSWWSQRPHRNPAGIGVTGRSSPVKPVGSHWVEADGTWIEGCDFESWITDSIPAHVGRLLAYALRDTEATPPQRDMITLAESYRKVPLNFRGMAPFWSGLNGRWAVPGRFYAQMIATTANAIARTAI